MENFSKNPQKCSGNTKPSTVKKSKKVREWSMTLWDKPVYDEKQMRYFISGKEECPETKRIHYQTYIYFYNAKSFDEVRKYFNKRNIHIEITKGEPKENIAYCSKDEDYEEFGEMPNQGKRTDLNDLADEISKGKKVDDIALENPIIFHQYGRTLNKLEDLALRKKWRTFMTEGVWIYGGTGTGKSHMAYENFHPDTHYNLVKDNGWWDGYTQQETVIINEYRGWIPYDELLTMVDKWSYSVRRRGKEPMPFMSKKVIITSSLPPEEVYHNRADNDSIEQLLRRFTIINLTEVYKE